MFRRAKPKQDETGNFVPNGQSAKSGLNKSIADTGWIEILHRCEGQGFFATPQPVQGRRVVAEWG